MRVVTVSPGPTRTAVWEAPGGLGAQLAAAANTGHEEFLAQVPAAMGMTTGRFTEPEETRQRGYGRPARVPLTCTGTAGLHGPAGATGQ